MGRWFIAVAVVLAWPSSVSLAARPAAAVDASPIAPVLSAPNSIWNAPLPANPPIDTNSANLVAALTAAGSPNTYPNTTAYSDPIYVVPGNQPRVPVILDGNSANLQKVLNLGVPIPPDVHPATGTDSLVVISQPSTNSVWDFWRLSTPAQNAPGAPALAWGAPTHGDSRYHISWGGVTDNASYSPGYFDDESWPGLSQTWWGNSASSLLTAAGIPLISEMEAGQINHAVGFQLPWSVNCAPVNNVWPAQRDDGANTSPNCVPEGTRVRLDPSLNLASLHLSPVALMVATAAQKYGMILHDGGGTITTVQLEDPTQYGNNPYTGPDGLFGGKPATQVFDGFPWSHMQVLQQSWRRNSIALTTTTTAEPVTTSIVSGQSVAFNVTVRRSDGSPAPGAVYLTDGGAIIGMAILTGGSAQVSAPLGAMGTHTLTVTYGGDENAKASASSAQIVDVSAPPPKPQSLANAPAGAAPAVSSAPVATASPSASAAPVAALTTASSPAKNATPQNDLASSVLGLFNPNNTWSLIPGTAVAKHPFQTALLYAALLLAVALAIPRSRRWLLQRVRLLSHRLRRRQRSAPQPNLRSPE